MLDMKRLRKLNRDKDEIENKLEALQAKIAQAENEDEIIDLLHAYQEKLNKTMKLEKADFEENDDFKYAFKMPLNCRNDTHCEWICQNMIKPDGIAPEV